MSNDDNGPDSRESEKLPGDPRDVERERETLPPAPPLPSIPPVEARLDRLEDAFGEQRDIFARWTRDLFDADGALARIAFNTEGLRGLVDDLKQATDEKFGILRSALERKFESQIGELKEQLTEVSLRLGMHEERESGRMRAAASSVPGAPWSALIVDDRADVRMAIIHVLEDTQAFTALEASSGNEAIEMINRWQFDCILSDIKMPGNGSTLLKHVREHHPEIAVILMSAYDARDTARQALESGAFGYLAKPFENNDGLILTCVRAAEFARAKAKRK